VKRALTAVALTVLLTGCAASVPPPASTPPPATPTADPAIPVPAVTPVRQVTGTTRAAEVDSLPSRDAVEVLATLPEPLATAPATPATRPTPTPPRPATPSSDTLPRVTAEPEPLVLRDSVTTPVAAIDHGVPVPSATRAMGDDPADSSITVVLDPPTTPAVTPTTPASPPPSTTAPTNPPTTAAADSVWRVQVAAPAERDKAERLRAAASSVLLVPFVIEREGALHKVRSQGRLVREAAERLRARAADSGFDGAFLLRQAEPR